MAPLHISTASVKKLLRRACFQRATHEVYLVNRTFSGKSNGPVSIIMQCHFHVSRPKIRIASEREVFVQAVDCPAVRMRASSPKRRALKHTCGGCSGGCSGAHAVGGNATTGSACSCGRKRYHCRHQEQRDRPRRLLPCCICQGKPERQGHVGRGGCHPGRFLPSPGP
jgi:hypothetical protein